MGSYVFRWPYPANDVHITGTFDDWGKSVQLNKVGDHWEKEVDLPSADEKVLYKFVVDDEWRVDDSAPKEGDGHYNTNNVLLPEHIKRKPASTKKNFGDVPGAFPETPMNEPASFGVLPIPATTGSGNPISLPAGARVPDQKEITSNTIGSSVTTSQEDYEKAGSSFPATTSKGTNEFSVNPIPASSGTGNPISLPAGATLPGQKDITSSTIGSGVTTSKEDYEKAGSSFPTTTSKEAGEYSINPMPASSGTGNPVTVPAGAKLPSQKDITSNTVDSSVTTSKEDYEQAGSSTAVPGSKTDDSSFSVNPIPATSGLGNPVSVPAGSHLPSQKDTTANTVGTGVTTSKEDYEKAGSSSAVPELKDGDQPSFSVDPIPSSSGVGNPISAPAGTKLPSQKEVTSNTIGSAVTTSKEDYEKAGSSSAVPEASADDPNAFSVKPIPASSGIGNPVSLAPGAPVPSQKDVTPHTVDSTVTTSKEDYDKAGSSTLPAGLAAGVAGGALGGAALASAFSVSKEKQNLIPESSLPMGDGAGKIDTLDSGPFISSVGPGSTTAELASKVPLESNPTIRSSGTGTTTAELASKVPFENTSTMKSGTDASTSKLASELEVPLKSSPFITSVGPGATTADLASKAPKENDPFIRSSGTGTTTADLASKVPLESDPTMRSSGPGTTTAALAAAVPLATQGVPDVVKQSISQSHEAPEAAASAEAVKEKLDLEKELLSKTTLSQATGAPASAAAEQSSYYGLATSVPQVVEKSLQQAHAAPEAASQTAAVAEKSAVEEELLRKVPSTDAAGEPAPTIAAATSPTAPTSTKPDTSVTGATSTAATATSLTDGKTANQAVPDTDTSSAAHGHSAGEIAGGAAVGGTAAALAIHHKDADKEPARIPDSQKPDITTEASPATATKDQIPGQAKHLSAGVSDGDTTTPITQGSKPTAPFEASEAATTEYAPPHGRATSPGVSSSAAAAISDGTEDPSLASEPAVKMMKQNEGAETSTGLISAPTTTATTDTAGKGISTSNKVEHGGPTDVSGVSALASTGKTTVGGSEKKDVGPSTTGVTSTDTPSPSTPAKKTTQASGINSPATSTATSTGTDKKKKRHRLSTFIKKIFD